jgi:monoamine oxidase
VCFLDKVQQLLTVYYTGNTSLFSKETLADAYAQARPMLEKGFKEYCPPFEKPTFAKDENFVTYRSPIGYSWPNDPYARGSYSYISPGQEAALTHLTEIQGESFKTLFTPIEDTLYFVGEHASILLDVPGTMEAACESGERAARTIIKTQKHKGK